MLRMKANATRMLSPAKGSTAGGGIGSETAAWEIRPGGMLVQKRNSDSNQSSILIPTIKIRVKYGSFFHDVNISSQASFGELKKMLLGPSGLHPQDQKLIYKDKERDSKAYLDVVGVKDGSKMVLIEDLMSQEKRRLESRKNTKIDRASKEIAEISLEVENLAKQVAALESGICSGKKVVETVLLSLIELLMTQLIKLDGILADGDLKLQRRMQVKRVQKYIETLDVLKIRNSMLVSNGAGAKAPLQQHQKISTGQVPIHVQKQKEQRNSTRHMPKQVVVTTKWETFDSGIAVKAPYNSASTNYYNTSNASAKLKWELFE